jgi:hypothetical protein
MTYIGELVSAIDSTTSIPERGGSSDPTATAVIEDLGGL